MSRAPGPDQRARFDEVAALGSWVDDADVLVLPELWLPHGERSVLDRLRGDHGFEFTALTRFVTLAFAPRPVVAHPGEGWWCLAVASRRPLTEVRDLPLPRGLGDPVPRRHAIQAVLELGEGRAADLVAFHVSSKLWFGSPLRQLRGLARHVGALGRDRPALLVGDANWWRTLLPPLLPGWRSTVRGATFPAWNAHSQIDHVLVRGATFVGGEVAPSRHSDHRAIRARLRL